MIRKITQLLSFLAWATPHHFMESSAGKDSMNTGRSPSFIADAAAVVSGPSLMGSSSSPEEMKWSERHVDTKLGVVQGFVVQPNGFRGVEVFLNMPYASPPVGSLRFMPPVSGSPWSGVRKSDKPSPVCPQVLPDIRNETEALKMMPRGRLTKLKRLLPHLRNQSEDCLYLNLYVPVGVGEGQMKNKLAVLVFVHGDDYGYGAGHPYDPTMLVSVENIIVITLNYRLGILGFLNANSDSHFRLPYNFALLDQIAALQWVQENIALFGGDRTNVTLMGLGKGAVLVNFLMISNAVPTGLLFHRVILSSGSALSPLSSDLSRGPELSKRFAKRVRCPPEPSSTMLECLREVPVRQFLESELWSLFGPSGDGIVVKNELPPDNVIINRISHYPMLFGVVKAETLPELSNHDATYGMENERRRELLKQFITKYYRFHRNEILAGAIHEYTDWEKPAQHPLNVREETLEALADAQVVAPLTKVGDLHSQSSRSRAFFYVFDYQSKFSDYQQRLGCVHTEDLLYVFGAPLYFYENESTGTEMMRSDISATTITRTDDSYNAFKNLPHRKERARQGKKSSLGVFTGNFTWYEVQLSFTIMRLWANFVRGGNPNGDLKSQVKGDRQNVGVVPQGKVNGPRDREGASSSSSRDSGTGGSHHSVGRDGRSGGGGRTGPSSTSGDGNRLLGRENLEKHGHTGEEMPEPIAVDWPQYESLDKKYLVLDLRPRVKSHYRAHKLSFWLHLVPDYQRNDEGTSLGGNHHGGIVLNPFDMINTSNNGLSGDGRSHQNLSKATSVLPSSSPTVYVSGLYELSVGGGGNGAGSNVIVHQQSPHNSSGSSPKLSPVYPAAIDPSIAQQDSGESSNTAGEESVFGFQSYSTALSVTIAIGCSLLVLNILIFATFYYEREKRLNALRRSTSFQQQQQQQQQLTSQSQSPKSKSLVGGVATNNPNQSFDSPRTQPFVSSGTSASLKRRRENGGYGIAAGEFAAEGESLSRGECGRGESHSYVRNRGPSSTENLHYTTTYANDDEAEEPFLSCSNSNLPCTSSGASYHPGNPGSIKRFYSDISGVGSVEVIPGSASSTIRKQHHRNQQPHHHLSQHSLTRRSINEHPMSIDMSEGVTNEANFSPQSRRTLQMGTTFVGIESPSCSSYQLDRSHHQQQTHQTSHHHHHHQLHSSIGRVEGEDQGDNSSMDDGH